MTSVKLGSSILPPSTTLRSAVERPVTQARPEVSTASLITRDEFISGESARNNGLLGTPPGVTALGELSKALDPFKDALDGIVGQIDPAVLDNPGKLGQFILDAVKGLGIAGQDLMDAVRYVSDKYAYNSGNTRLV